MEKKTDRKIMIVDDSRGVLEAFDALLGEDYTLITVENGYRAMNILCDNRPSLIFMDVHMPGMDGMRLLACIRDKGICSNVVIVSGASEEGIEEEADALGAYAYVRKPFDIEEIEEIAERVLGPG
ncbi:MAG: response regulator [Thermodesulfobacteriota bacterium]